MTDLQQLQQDFFAFLNGTKPQRILPQLDHRGLDAQVGMQIYAHAYRVRLLQVLQEDYPGVQAMLGEEAFSQMAESYLAAHPSQHFSLRYFGEALASFLTQHSPYQRYPLLAELAEWERLMRTVFDSGEQPSLTAVQLQQLTAEAWPELRLTLQPHVQRFDQHHNTLAVWQALKNEQAPPAPTALTHPQPWLAWRQAYQTQYRSLAVDEACALDQLSQADCSFAELCELLSEWYQDDAPQAAVRMLQGWLSSEILVNTLSA